MLDDFEEVGTLMLEDTLDLVDSQPYFLECLSVQFKIIWIQGLRISAPAVSITKEKSMGTIQYILCKVFGQDTKHFIQKFPDTFI